jgi:hypothetical protein
MTALTRRQTLIGVAVTVAAAALPAVAQAKVVPATERRRLMREFEQILRINSHHVDVRTMERLANAAMGISQ